MTTELTLLAWTLVLALVQIFATATVRTKQYGSKWNAGARDEALPPPTPLVGRLQRAQSNLYETLPLFAAAVLIAHAAGRESATTALGAQLYFWGRVIYVPLYALGIPYIRSLVWLVSLAGLTMIIGTLLTPA
jgi:uncharacterized MAPEG superfamily protein